MTSEPRIPVPLWDTIKSCCDVPASLHPFRERSPVGFLVERTFALAQLLSIATWLFGTRAYSHHLEDAEVRTAFEIRRSWCVDFYILAWSVVLFATHVALEVRPAAQVCTAMACLGAARLVDIVQANVNMHVFDGVRLATREHHVASVLRSTLISVWNYVELIGWFAILYLWAGGLQCDTKGSKCQFDAIYFSTITQLTIGFGDLKPITSCSRVLAMTQGLLGTLFFVFAISRFASLLPHATQHEDKK